MKRIGLIALAFVLSSGMAFSVTLINKDSKSYDIKVKRSSSTTSTSIGSNTTKMNICKKCTIEVDGVGSMKAEGDVKVIIKDGKLKKD